jgi:hypothetical protein
VAAEIFRAFSHEHNALEVATQEYRHAKEHFREVLHYRDCTNPDHQRRFRDALDRQEEARDRYVAALMAR